MKKSAFLSGRNTDSLYSYLQQHLDDKHLCRFLEADGVLDLNDQAEFKSKTGVSYEMKCWKFNEVFVFRVVVFCGLVIDSN
ncbi:hypothetical protein SASPL_150813 [Salvia splendens]|uniref:Uncharacterized protein n=1 Tax=Salvia splendens TaxID=180675 RepID=A0A8X8W782_SALSN|nr:hypothetical protein SASPL_150813 [Salvia splendens]